MTNYFVWAKNTHGIPEAQIWFGKQTDGNGKARITLIPLVPLLDGDTRSIEELKQAYPYEKE